MPDVAIITAIYDQYDTLKPVKDQIGADVEWVLVTDSYWARDNFPEEIRGYRVVYDNKPHLHPNRAAKWPKMLPWEYTDANESVWVDASFRIKSPYFAVDTLNVAEPIAQFVHPWRDCIYDEAEETLKLERYRDVHDIIPTQMNRYRDMDHPKNWGLWATGIIARRHTGAIKDFGRDWLFENMQFSYQDQLSHPNALRRNDLYPAPLPGTHFSNPWTSYEASGRHS